MNTDLLNWITENIFVPKSKDQAGKAFLTMLRDNPKKIEEYVNTNLHQWVMRAVINRTISQKPGGAISNDLTGSGSKVVAHLKTFFAKELQALG